MGQRFSSSSYGDSYGSEGPPPSPLRLVGGAGERTVEEGHGGGFGGGVDKRVSKGMAGMKEQLDCSSEVKCYLVGGGCCLTILILVIVVAGSWITLDVKDVALAYESLDPYLINKTFPGPGIKFWPELPPFPGLVLWPQREQEVLFERRALGLITCNSQDGLRVVLDVSFQYKIPESRVFDLSMKYKDFDTYSKLIESVARANIQHSCGEFTAENFQTLRNDVANTISIALKGELSSKLFAIVSQTQLRNIARPTEYDNAVRDKENALNEIKLAEAERNQAVTLAKTNAEKKILEGLREVDTARRDAAVEILEADADAAAILDRYQALAVVYKNVQDTHSLSIPGVIAYIGNEIFSGERVKSTVAMDAPSKLSYQEEL